MSRLPLNPSQSINLFLSSQTPLPITARPSTDPFTMSDSQTYNHDATATDPSSQEDRPYPSNLKLLLIGNSAVGEPCFSPLMFLSN